MFSASQSRRGSTYLEVQVAMVLLAIGMAGMYSMSVVQTKQTRRLIDVLPAAEIPALNRSGDPWARKLGVYASVDEIVTPPAAVLPYSYAEQVVNDGDGAPSITTFQGPLDTHGFISFGHTPSYQGDYHYHRSYGNIGSYFEFQATGLPVGEYEVLTTYYVYGSLGNAIPHQIYDGPTLRTTVNVNQKIATSDVSYDGKLWDRLAVVQVNTGTLRVRLVDGPGCTSYILADAILVRSARSFDVVSVAETAGGGATAILEAP
jgi:hypothetical protein